ncbi:MAG: hypothetical protein ABI630_01190 [Betaproteobacteria bacterium]
MNQQDKRRYKFDFRDRVSRLRARTAIVGKAVNVRVRVAGDPDSPSITGFGELDADGHFDITFMDLEGEHRVLRVVYESLLWEIHCREG